MQLNPSVFGHLYKQDGAVRHYAGYNNLEFARADNAVTSSVEHAGQPEESVEIEDTDQSSNTTVGFKKLADGTTYLTVTNAGGDHGAYVEVSVPVALTDAKYLGKDSLLQEGQHVSKVKLAPSDEGDIWLHATGPGTDRIFQISGGSVKPYPR